MKALYTYLLVWGLVITVTGCDPFHSSSSGDDSKQLEFTTTVETRGLTGLEDGDVIFFNGTGNKRVIATTSTVVLRQTPSCNAFDRVQPNQVSNGDVLLVKYSTANSVYEGSRHVVRASRIEAYRAECISGSGLEETNLTPCQILEILNNGTCPLSGDSNND